jgi:hypothetical protein
MLIIASLTVAFRVRFLRKETSPKSDGLDGGVYLIGYKVMVALSAWFSGMATPLIPNPYFRDLNKPAANGSEPLIFKVWEIGERNVTSLFTRPI